MSDRFARLLLRLFPEEFRDRYGPQIEADLFHPGSNRAFAVADIVLSALLHRLLSPAPYVWISAFALAGTVIGGSIPLLAHLAVSVFPTRWNQPAALWSVMFFAVFVPIVGTMLVAIQWLQTYRRMKVRKCSKSRI